MQGAASLPGDAGTGTRGVEGAMTRSDAAPSRIRSRGGERWPHEDSSEAPSNGASSPEPACSTSTTPACCSKRRAPLIPGGRARVDLPRGRWHEWRSARPSTLCVGRYRARPDVDPALPPCLSTASLAPDLTQALRVRVRRFRSRERRPSRGRAVRAAPRLQRASGRGRVRECLSRTGPLATRSSVEALRRSASPGGDQL
jgi:hypothetical protein